MTAEKRSTVVIGGGVAGVAAAITLAEGGENVVLIEAGESLGGKVKGWFAPDGCSLEHGMHGWWHDYTNFRQLLDRLGVFANLTAYVDELRVYQSAGGIDRLRTWDLPSPFHLLGYWRGLRSLGAREKLSCVRALLSILAYDPSRDSARFDQIDMLSWLRRKNVATRAIDTVFEPVLRSNLFLPVGEISAAAGIHALQLGLRNRNSWKFSWLRGNPLTHLWQPILEHLRSLGVRVEFGTHVRAIREADGIASAVECATTDGDEVLLSADSVIAAIDIESTKRLVRASFGEAEFLRKIENLRATDVLVTRTWISGRLESEHHHGLLRDARVVDVFIDVGHYHEDAQGLTHTVVETQSYIAAHHMNIAPEDLMPLVLSDLERVFPGIREREVAYFHVLKHPRVFSAFETGSERYRPAVRTQIPNVYLAGDWVSNGRSDAFMEHALTTGVMAANAVIEAHDRVPTAALAAAPIDWPVRCIQFVSRIGSAIARTVQSWIRWESLTSERDA